MSAPVATKNLIEVRDLQVHFALNTSFKSRLTGRGGQSVKAVDGVSFDLQEGEVLGLVGESGSGKTTLGRALLGLVRPTGGSVKLRGEELVGLPERDLRPKRRHLQMVFQDPHASLNPGMTLQKALAHPLEIHKLTNGAAETQAKVRETLELVGLSPTERFARELPERAVGRAEAARRDRAGDHHRPGPGRGRRARLDARHERAGEDPRPDDRPQAPDRADVRLRHARPGLGQVLLRPRGDHVPRPDRRDRVRRRDLQRPQAPVHAGADPRDPGAGPGQGAPARPAPRRDPRRGAAAARLLVPPALPEGVRHLRLGEPGPADDARAALGRGRRGDVRHRAAAGRRPRQAQRLRARRVRPGRLGQGPGRSCSRCWRRSAARSPTSRCGRA